MLSQLNKFLMQWGLRMKGNYIKLLVLCLGVPIIVAMGVFLFSDRAYAWVSLCVAVLAIVPIFISFEKGSHSSIRLVILAVMIALSVAGRFVFAWLPHFKPVTAMVIITGMYLGYECGFVCGAFTALISNFYFGQGPWTPFQMFAWGIVGLVSGVLAKYFEKYVLVLFLYGAAAGVLYSFILDVWTTLWWDGSFNFTRFIVNITTAVPVTAIYAISNVIFLFLLSKPLGKKIKRIKIKYGI